MTTKFYKAERASARETGTLVEAGFGVEYIVRPVKNPGALKRSPECNQHLTAWQGRSNKPVVNYRVKEADVEKYVSKLVENAKVSVQYEAEQATLKKLDTAQNRASFQIGVLLYDSWGYDQTNIDFYEVVGRSKTGATVTIRPIASAEVEKTGDMSGIVKPVPGRYIGGSTKHRVTNYGVKVGYNRWASPTTADKTYRYSSWA